MRACIGAANEEEFLVGSETRLFALSACRISPENAEADAFFLFSALMSEVRNNFIETLDNTNVGIRAQIRRYERMLEIKDPELSKSLVCARPQCATV